MQNFTLNLFTVALISLTLFTGCDDGRIYPKEVTATAQDGRTVKITGNITGQNTWADGYEVVLAAFDDKSNYALAAKNIPADSNVSMTMNAIPVEAKTIELCVINRLRQRVVTILKTDIIPTTSPHDTIRIDVGTIHTSMLATIQKNVFTPRCATCHGGSQQAAAGIHLTDGNTYKSIVGKPSRRVRDKHIVEAGHSTESVLDLMLHTDISRTWGYDHSNADLNDEWKNIITRWIDNGALE